MKRRRFTEEQIAFALKRAELGTKVDEICRKMGISDATFYKWRQRYGGLGPWEVRRLRQLEEENAKLKRLVADLGLDKAMPRVPKKALRPSRERELATDLMQRCGNVGTGATEPARPPRGRALLNQVDHFVAAHNANCQPFRWTATADSILQKLYRLRSRIRGTAH